MTIQSDLRDAVVKIRHEPLPRWPNTSILAAIAVFFAVLLYVQGQGLASDTLTYSNWADKLILFHFNYLEFARKTTSDAPPILYIGWLTVVALFKLVLGSAWMTGIVVLNYCLALLAVWKLLELVAVITRSTFSVLLAGSLILVAYELFNWIHFVLSDTSFMGLSFILYCLLCTSFISPTHRNTKSLGLAWGHFGVVILLTVALFYRPGGVPLLLVAGLALIFRQSLNRGAQRASLARRGGVLFCLLAATAILVHAYLMKNPESWPFSFASDAVQKLSANYHRGEVIDGRPETNIFNPNSWFDFIHITLTRFVYFFFFFVKPFSFIHKVGNFVFFVPTYAFAFLAGFKVFQKNRLSAQAWWSCWIALLWIASYALFHSMLRIDYDWRYRLPCMLPLIVMACVGFQAFLAGSNHSPPVASRVD